MNDLEQLLGKMHEALAQELLGRILSGQASAQDLSCARQFLRDNCIDVDRKSSATVHKLSEHLPFADPDTKVG